jgi:hypothetical protein
LTASGPLWHRLIPMTKASRLLLGVWEASAYRFRMTVHASGVTLHAFTVTLHAFRVALHAFTTTPHAFRFPPYAF